MAAWDPVVDAWMDLPAWTQTWAKALLFAFVAFLVYEVLKVLALRAMTRSTRIDATLRSFFSTLITTGGWIGIALAFLAGLGVEASALLGGVAVSGFIIGFALKDTLNNLASGVLLLLYRPFTVGEAVQVQGHDGVVTTLGIGMTRLTTWDGKYVAIPNGAVLGGAILNYSRNPTRRLDVTVDVAYGDNLDDAVRAVMDMMQRDERVLADPVPMVRVTRLAESGVTLEARAWIDTTRTDLLRTLSDLTRGAKDAVEAAGCTIPFPQRDLHVRGDPASAGLTPSGGT